MEDGRGRNQGSPELVMPGKGNILQNQKTHPSNIFCRKTEGTPFTKAIKNGLVRGALLLRSLLGVPCRPGLTVGNAVIKLSYLIAKVMLGSGNNRGQMSVIYYQEQGGCNYCNEQQGQSGSQGVLTCRELR